VTLCFGIREILEHAVDSGAEVSDFVLAGNLKTRQKISARSDLRDAFAQIGNA
jgi:hypothetical protein